MKISRHISVVLASIVLAFTLCVGTSCSPSNEDVIRSTVTKEFDAYKNMEDAALSKIAKSAEDEGLDQLGITGQNFASAVLDGFDYSIDSIDVNDKAATVTMTIVSKSTSDFEKKLDEAVSAFVSSAGTDSLSADEKNEQIGKIAMNTFKDTEIITEDVTLDFELQGSTWVSTNATDVLGSLDSLVFSA